MPASLLSKLFLIAILLTGVQTPAQVPPPDHPCTNKNICISSMFDTTFRKGLYKTSFDISKHHLSGLMFLKRTSAESIRLMFSNEVGMTFFDIEVADNNFIVHSCFPSMNKRALMKILERDFRMILLPPANISRFKEHRSSDPNRKQIAVRTIHGSFIYTIVRSLNRPVEIRTKHTIAGKTILVSDSAGSSCPDKISLRNPFIGLRIEMTRLKK